MATIFEKIKKHLVMVSLIIIDVPLIISSVVIIIGKLNDKIEKLLTPSLIAGCLIILTCLIISNIILFISFYIKQKNSKNKKNIFKYDVWWDRDATPLCPNCKKPLIRVDGDVYSVECPDYKSCDIQVELKDENNKRISVKDATAKIKEIRTC